ncbi:hypothetical protein Bcep18194_B0763 [Burkholderia lata]|uniref:DUF805 domain-containing protein n=2 Tax=Burkholderia lata (strain ATCC 17760 / DSM 23089 / LMG 22485 / NCIMB 9086 / R18194 / 383) TaxID=482957 RepID=Q399I4_BURL3|nr:hypothetical protein Bcep18194_B0763 [Burkholderia lata]
MRGVTVAATCCPSVRAGGRSRATAAHHRRLDARACHASRSREPHAGAHRRLRVTAQRPGRSAGAAPRHLTPRKTMEHFTAWQLVVSIVLVAVVIYPYVRIVRRTGHSGWWILTMFVPVLNFIMLWVFAFARWPTVDDRQP